MSTNYVDADPQVFGINRPPTKINVKKNTKHLDRKINNEIHFSPSSVIYIHRFGFL
jgi:hypothetical protein